MIGFAIAAASKILDGMTVVNRSRFFRCTRQASTVASTAGTIALSRRPVKVTVSRPERATSASNSARTAPSPTIRK